MGKSRWKHKATWVESGKRMYSTSYLCWRNMRTRCRNKNVKEYKDYGGRGIRVCAAWDLSFDAFVDDMGEAPAGMTLDRINPNGHYEKNNCRWVSRTENQRNQRRSKNITWRGETRHLIEWAAIVGIPYETLRSRVVRRKWDLDRAMTEKLHRRDT